MEQIGKLKEIIGRYFNSDEYEKLAIKEFSNSFLVKLKLINEYLENRDLNFCQVLNIKINTDYVVLWLDVTKKFIDSYILCEICNDKKWFEEIKQDGMMTGKKLDCDCVNNKN